MVSKLAITILATLAASTVLAQPRTTPEPGRTYRIEFKDSLDAPQWTSLGTDVIANASAASSMREGVRKLGSLA